MANLADLHDPTETDREWTSRNAWGEGLPCDECDRPIPKGCFEHDGTDNGLCGACYGIARGYLDPAELGWWSP